MVFRLTGDDTQIYLTKDRRDEATSKALDEMRSIADEDGAYDIDYSDYLSRFDK